MATGVFRDVAFHLVAAHPPQVPSTIVLPEDSPAVLPTRLAVELEGAGWEIRHIPGVHHDMHLEAPERTLDVIADRL